MTDPPSIEPTFVRATRVAYDTVAVDYAELLRDELAAKPVDRALLSLFAELVRGGGPVADQPPEKVLQTYLLARKGGAASTSG